MKNPLIKSLNPINELFINDYANTFFYNKRNNGNLSIWQQEEIKNINISVSTILFNDRLSRNKIYVNFKKIIVILKSNKIIIHKSNQANSHHLFRYVDPEGNLIGDIIKNNNINVY